MSSAGLGVQYFLAFSYLERVTFLNGVRAPREFWSELTVQLADWKIDVTPSSELQNTGRGRADVVVRGRTHAYDAVVAPASRVTRLLSNHSAPSAGLLLISDKVTTRTGSALRLAGIDYVDACGGASIAFDDVIVGLSGSGTPRLSLPSNDAGSGAPATNLFSAGRAQVLAVLLSWPEVVHSPVRTIARVAGTSVGLVHDVLSALETLGHLDHTAGTTRLSNTLGLARSWAAAFPSGLRRKLELGIFYSDPSRWQTVAGDATLGGEWAVRDLLEPARATVYTRQIDAPLIADLRLRTAEAGEANTTVLLRFWQSPTPEQHRHIPWVVTFAELSMSPDARVQAAANDFLDSHVG